MYRQNKDRFTPRNIIQNKYDRTRGLLFLFAGVTGLVAFFTVVSVVPNTPLSISWLGNAGTILEKAEPQNQIATAVDAANEDNLADTAKDELPDSEEVTFVPEERPVPIMMRIPKIDLSVGFVEPLGVGENDEIEVPDSYTEVGWYEHGPVPGDQGPAIVLGHVDSYDGPAVLYPLAEVEVGDSIYIERSDGITTRFVVEALERPSQDEFPTEKVYGNIDYAGLRIITCTGTFVHNEQRYTHNLVVSARLVGLDFENSTNL